MNERIAFINARLVDPASNRDEHGALLVENGVIADIGPHLFSAGVPAGIETVDCGGHVLSPALIDMRVHLREPGEEEKETIETATAAAAAGGIGTVVALPNTDPPIDNPAMVEFVVRRGREAGNVRVEAYGALTQGIKGQRMTELGLLNAAGAVAFTDGTSAVSNPLVMRRILAYASAFGLLIVQHPDVPELTEGGAMNEGELATRLGLSGISPAAEAMMIERDLRLVAMTGGRYHVAHVSTGESVELVRRAKERGLAVTCDTAPPYFGLNETAVGDWRTFAKVFPPLRSETDRQAIVAGLADGTIDAIASDHAPQDQEAKRLPFIQAEAGAVGLETLLPLTLELVHTKRLGLKAALALVTSRPAAILDLPRGRLAKGAPADLTVIDLDRPWKVDEAALLSKSKNTPFGGRPVQGHALRTVIAGRTVFNTAVASR
ncbi:MAG TPA: dihydroorotase [Alphaproteobacteria bacterium]|nr:dihydroorotase [Alphaproteobacteria bacterium]